MICFLKRIIKNIFIRLNLLGVFDKLNYGYALARYGTVNADYKKKFPGFHFPPNYYLYETYRLNYQHYKEDGELTAREMIERVSDYVPGDMNILEWGCGVARMTRHIPALVTAGSTVVGADINASMINWNTRHINKIQFLTTAYYPPTSFCNGQFNIVFGLSVFTHIELECQQAWLDEIHRILSPKGLFVFTTHGAAYECHLGKMEKEVLKEQGAYTIFYKRKGHRMMSTYNRYENLLAVVCTHFEVLEYSCGASYPEKVGGQDLWIVQKR